MPAQLVGVDVRLDRKLAEREDAEGVGAAGLELVDLRLDVGVSRLVADRLDDELPVLRAEALAEAGQEIAAVRVRLVEDRDLRLLRVRLEDVVRVDLPLGGIRRRIPDRPGIRRRVAAERACAG